LEDFVGRVGGFCREEKRILSPKLGDASYGGGQKAATGLKKLRKHIFWLPGNRIVRDTLGTRREKPGKK